VIRRSIPESQAFEGRRDSGAQPGIAHLLSAFHGRYLWLTIKVSLMVMGAQGGVWAVNFWMPTYLRTVRHLSASGTGIYVAVQQFGALIGFLLWRGGVSTRDGRWAQLRPRASVRIF
jgi:hypothetical protein